MVESVQEATFWDASPFDHGLGTFWDPRFPEDRYTGSYYMHMDLPFVEIELAERPARDWGLHTIAGVLKDGREVLLIAHENATHAGEVAREGGQRYKRYTGVGALVGVGATLISEATLIRSGTLRGQNIARWMGAASPDSVVIGADFISDVGVPEISATVERASRRLTIDLGVGLPLRPALTVLDQSLYLARKAIGCLSSVHTVAREQTICTDSGQTFLWHYAEWEAPMREPLSSHYSVLLERCGPLGTIVNRFQYARLTLWPIAGMLYVNLAFWGPYSEHRFVSLIAALEGVYEKLHGATPKDKRWTGAQAEAFGAAHKALKKHLTDAENAVLKDEMLGVLKNERTLSQKLDHVFELIGVEVESRLGIDRSAWKKLAIDHRNTTAHLATTSIPQSDISKDGSMYRALSIVTEELLRRLLLMEMKIDDGARDSSAMRASSNLRHAGFDGFFAV